MRTATPRVWIHKVIRKIQATSELYHKAMGTVDTPEKFEAKRWELANRVWAKMKETDSRECRNCHDFNAMDLSEQDRPDARNTPRRRCKARPVSIVTRHSAQLSQGTGYGGRKGRGIAMKTVAFLTRVLCSLLVFCATAVVAGDEPALSRAALAGELASVEQLFAGADVNGRNEIGMTALMYAAEAGRGRGRGPAVVAWRLCRCADEFGVYGADLRRRRQPGLGGKSSSSTEPTRRSGRAQVKMR